MIKEMNVLIEEHYPAIFRFLLYLGSSKEEAEDLTQETFYRALKSIHTLKDPNSFKPWLYAIARNMFRSHCRRKKTTVLPEEIPETSSAITTVEDRYLLQEALKTLNEDQQQVVILKLVYGFKFEEIGAIMQKDPAAVKSQFHRARIKLAKNLDLGEKEE